MSPCKFGKMAKARVSQDEFMCPVCLDILKDPVTTSCGHSYCNICITRRWDQEDQMSIYSCPQCRQTFSPRPLAKNTMLTEVMEKLKETKLPVDCYTGTGDVQFSLKDFYKEDLKISDRVTFTNIEPKTRNDFLQYSQQLTLDLNTVNEYLHLSENNRTITYTGTVQPYPDHPDRFDAVNQVLCRESVCGRCYWEVEWSGEYVCISVSYKSISRKGWGYECGFGFNDQSWSWDYSSSRFTFRHNNRQTDLYVPSISSRVGVYVDHSAGTLSFYSISDTMSLVHKVQTTFTQPLYPGLTVCGIGSSLKLSDKSK